MRSSCPSGKRPYPTYASALAALADLEDRGQLRGPFGSIYTCGRCGEFHISSRRFTPIRRKGRGKSRSGIVHKKGA